MTLCPFPDNLRETVLNGRGQINLVEKISKELRIQTVTWLQLVAFRKVCSDRWIQM